MVRVAFLTHEPFFPPSGGGSAEALYLVEEMVKRGWDVHLFCPTFPHPDHTAEQFGVTPHLFEKWEMGRYARLRNVKYLAFPFFLRRMVERAHGGTPFDLVIGQHAIAAAAAGPLRRRLGCVVVLNFLDLLTGFMETWPSYVAPRPVVRALERFEVSLPQRHGVDGVLVVSDALAELLAETGYARERIKPIYYGYDSQRFRRSPEMAGIAADPPVIVMHGSFDQHHLGPIAREGLAEVARRRPDVRFRFIGRETPGLSRFCRELRRMVPGVNLELTGFVPYDEVSSCLATATIGIVPYEESLGTHCAFVAKVVEYVGLELPVVSTPLRSVQTYFGEFPTVAFSEFTGASFANAILVQLEASRAAQGEELRRARERVAAELDWRVIARKAVDFVNQTLVDKSKRKL